MKVEELVLECLFPEQLQGAFLKSVFYDFSKN